MKIWFVTLLFVGMFVPVLSARAASRLYVAALPHGGGGSGSSFSVPDTAFLRALPTTAGSAGGIWRNTDGVANAPPLFYLPDTGNLCTADDGGACVAAAAGGAAYWRAVFSAEGADWREWGIAAGTPDVTAANAALAWAASTGGLLLVPPGEFKFTQPLIVTGPTVGSITIRGTSRQNSIVSFSGSNGFVLKSQGPPSTLHVQNLTIATYDTPSAGYTGLFYQQLGAGPGQSNIGMSDVLSVTFRGIDGLQVTDGWANDFKTDYVSNINFFDDQFADPGNQGTGILLAGQGPSGPNFGVVYNINSCFFGADLYGVYYGPYIQGVNITQSNFEGGIAVYVPAGEAGQSQLTFSNNQVNYLLTGFSDASGVYGEFITNNFFLPDFANAYAIGLGHANDATITGNVVKDYNLPPLTGTTGINITASTLAVIQGNIFDAIGTGISLQSGTTGIRVADNEMINVTTPYFGVSSPTAFRNALTPSGPAFTGVIQVGATGNTPNWVQLTVTTTTGFYNGEWVCVSGTSGPDQANICTTISITDSTHMVEQGVASDGSFYSSTGIVSAVP